MPPSDSVSQNPFLQPPLPLLPSPTNRETKRVFVAATRMNDGKTTTCLGLYAALQSLYPRVGFIKPVGQRFVDVQGTQVDEDSYLLDTIYNVRVPIQSMSPVTIDATFTRRYLKNPGQLLPELKDKICRAFDRVSWEKDFTLIEGTGHAGVGSVFDLSNASVAKLLKSPVILVCPGGIGRPVDEIALNKNFFDKAGVEVMGAIVNKAFPHEFERIDHWMRRALEAMGVRLLGVIPYDDDLARASMLNLFERFRGKVLNGEAAMGQPLGKVVLGAMSAGSALEHLSGHVTLICPSDREDVLISALSAMYIGGRKDFALASIVLTGPDKLSGAALQMIRRTSIPVLHVEPDAFSVVAEVHAANIKILPEDEAKIRRAVETVQERIDLTMLLDSLSG